MPAIAGGSGSTIGAAGRSSRRSDILSSWQGLSRLLPERDNKALNMMRAAQLAAVASRETGKVQFLQ
jgi:hypothetical protein